MNSLNVLLHYFLESPAGKREERLFANLITHYKNRAISSVFYDYITSKLTSKGYAEDFFPKEDMDLFELDNIKYESFDQFYNDSQISFLDEDEAKLYQGLVPLLSIQLFDKYPDYAFPYLLPRHFYILEIVFRSLGIDLPKIPTQYQRSARINYYFELCKSIYEFRVRHSLSMNQFCAMFYGCSADFVKNALNASPTRSKIVYLLYANPLDRKNFLDKMSQTNEFTSWEGRNGMMPGDIALIYETAPTSSITSLWRIVTPGFDDPFFPRKGGVFISDPIKLPAITFDDLCNNEIWAKNPLLKAHMQNGNGRSISSEEYTEIIKIAIRKDNEFQQSKVPSVPLSYTPLSADLKNEHDVEKNVLEPLLKHIGYAEDDWETQLSIRTGRSFSSRPDYLLHVEKNQETGTVKAKYVFEAKYTIPNGRELKKAHAQAVAYATLLQASTMSLVSKEGLWISRKVDGFAYNKMDFYKIDDLQDTNLLTKIRVEFK